MKAIGWLILLSMSAIASAQPAPPPTSPAFTTKGSFFAISVADLDASARWYSEKLGMKVVMDVPESDGTAMKLLEGGGLMVEMIQDDRAVPLGTAAPQIERDYRVHGIFKAGVVVEDWDRLLATLRERGVEIAIGPFPPRADQRANLIIRDNGGNYLQFFGDFAEPAAPQQAADRVRRVVSGR